MKKNELIKIIEESNLSEEEKRIVLEYINNRDTESKVSKDTVVLALLKLMELAPAIYEQFSTLVKLWN